MERAESAQIAFYVQRARESGGEALELGCGTGVMAVALALEGVAVHAVESSEDLAARALERRRALGIAPERCRIEHADPRSLRLPRSIGLVLAPADSLLSLASFDDLLAVFATARAHLAKDGRFALDVRQIPGLLEDEPDSHPGLALREREVRRPHLRARAGAGGVPVVQRLRLLGARRAHIEDALAQCGLELVEEWGGFSGEALTPSSTRLVAVAQASRRTPRIP